MVQHTPTTVLPQTFVEDEIGFGAMICGLRLRFLFVPFHRGVRVAGVGLPENRFR
jgi:hypothetical protein